MAKQVRSPAMKRGSAGRRRSRSPKTAELQAISPDGAIPADAFAASSSRLGEIRVGNRVFSARPKTMGSRKLDILPDMPDIRDRIYLPNLRALLPTISPRAFPFRYEIRVRTPAARDTLWRM